ncbi:MAG: hypothetical protein QOJ65_489 [Fimbriimonadaceae bacterium]|nr:hypothetical protein [Fimbriimonadaceae bacterium]
MIISTLLFLTLRPAPELGPMMPPNSNASFHAAVLAVEDKLYASDFEGAAKAATLLPKSQIVIHWDDSKVPADLREEFAAQRDIAVNIWRGITKATITFGKTNPDVKFSFEPVLATVPGTSAPAGATLFWSSQANEPRVEAVIGLKRGSPPEPIASVNVHNEVAYALGSYFGLDSSLIIGAYMGRTDENLQQVSRPLPNEILYAGTALKIAKELRLAVKNKKRLTPARPRVFFEPKNIDMGTVVQGDDTRFELQLTNSGNAPLAIRFSPDCGCITTTRYEVIKPGASYIMTGAYDTMMSVGIIKHLLYLTSNDAETPSLTVPVGLVVKPRYRLLMPEGDVVSVPEGGADVVAYLALTEGANIEPKEAELNGPPGTVTFEPWTGDLADPEMGEKERPRKGYKVTAHLTGHLPVPGRSQASIVLTTGNPRFPMLQANFSVQRGIVVQPQDLFMGELTANQRKFVLVVSGPAKSFRVKSVTTDWPHLAFETSANASGSEYRIVVTYDGKGEPGPVFGSVFIETENAAQPKLTVPIKASVK